MKVYSKDFEKMDVITFKDLLAKAGKTEDDIEKIYHGKDHHCRCGCGGNYFYKGVDKAGYTRAVNKMKDPTFESYNIEGDPYGGDYINIPDANRDNMCYCIYFKKEGK